ncbi:DNA-binding MarR family transcriptional regulator [Luteibacter sp. HA06]
MHSPCNNLSMILAARRTEILFNEALAPVGLVAPQYSLLLIICDIGPIEHAALARIMVQSARSLTAALRPLRKAGLIEPVDDGTGKGTMWRGTVAGRRVVKRAERHWKRAQDAVEQRLGPQRAATLRQTLAVIAGTDFSGAADASHGR